MTAGAKEVKLDQFSQQNTHCGTVFLQNRSLGAPDVPFECVSRH